VALFASASPQLLPLRSRRPAPARLHRRTCSFCSISYARALLREAA
jgi:hypothetical protein